MLINDDDIYITNIHYPASYNRIERERERAKTVKRKKKFMRFGWMYVRVFFLFSLDERNLSVLTQKLLFHV
jgi:uncharacterized membrane protein